MAYPLSDWERCGQNSLDGWHSVNPDCNKLWLLAWSHRLRVWVWIPHSLFHWSYHAIEFQIPRRFHRLPWSYLRILLCEVLVSCREEWTLLNPLFELFGGVQIRHENYRLCRKGTQDRPNGFPICENNSHSAVIVPNGRNPIVTALSKCVYAIFLEKTYLRSSRRSDRF